MKTSQEMNDIFTLLRNQVKRLCHCGNDSMLSPHFHNSMCDYFPVAMVALGYTEYAPKIQNEEAAPHAEKQDPLSL
jgi:hypothetical protein